MDSLSTAVTSAWVLIWLAALGICVPAAALGPAVNRTTLIPELGAALVWTWLTIAVGVPLAAAVHALNWVTALLLAVAWPTALWLFRARGEYQSTFRDTVRWLVYRAVARKPARAFRLRLGEHTAAIVAMPLLAVPTLVTGPTDIRLPMAADFDTLWHTRLLLDGTTAWDPLASLQAVLIRLSAADVLHVAAAIRLALIALTAIAVGVLVNELFRRRVAGAAAALAIVVLTPLAPANTWAITLVAVLGATSLVAWIRDGRRRDGWHAVAALLLAIGLLAPFFDRLEVLARLSASGQFLEHRPAALEAIRIARSESEDTWVVVGPPELELEIGHDGRVDDLARFVARFRDRAGRPSFRFDLVAQRLFVFVEKQPVEARSRDPGRGVGFVASQPAIYRVPRERSRLQRQAMALCDDYQRTHTGATIIHDDAELRIYRFDL